MSLIFTYGSDDVRSFTMSLSPASTCTSSTYGSDTMCARTAAADDVAADEDLDRPRDSEEDQEEVS